MSDAAIIAVRDGLVTFALVWFLLWSVARMARKRTDR